MNRFCLVILSDGCSFEGHTSVQGQGYISHFAQSVNILCDQLCLAADTEVLEDTTWNVQDPACCILERKPKFGFSIVAQESYQQQLQSHAVKPLLFSGTKWHNLSTNKNGLSKLGDVLLQMMTVSTSIQPSQPRDEESEVEHLAEQVHQLADLLPVQEGAPLNVYWIVAGETPDIRSHLPLFGALKRLKEWHGAHITPVCNQQFDRVPFEKSWGKFLSLSTIDVTSLELHLSVHLDAVWHGSIVFEKKNSRLVLPGFKMLLDRRQTRGCSLQAAEVHLGNSHDKERCNKDRVAESLVGCEMKILDSVEKSSVLLHMFLPLKLKLHLHSSSQKMSHQLMNWLSQEHNTEVALIGCLSFESTSSKRHKEKDREAWISHIKSGGSSSKPAGSCAVERSSQSMSRMCMLCGDRSGGVDVFILRPSEQFDGKLLDSLAVIASSCSLAVDSNKGSFCFLDLTDSLVTRESLLAQNQLQLIQGELERRKTNETRDTDMRCSDLIAMITTARLQNIRELREKSVTAQQRQLNVLSDTVIQVKSEFSLSPSSWPERLWLRQSDSSAQEDGKSTETTEPSNSVSCFDILDILSKFQSDGRPVRDDLSPVMAAGGGAASEEYVRINTSFDVIRRTPYPESLGCRFHGVEYCLDTCDALKKDTELANLQKSLIKSETVSTCVEPVSIIHKTSTQPRVRSGGMSTRQKPRLARTTRKRPLDTDKVVKQCDAPQTRSSSKSTKRKRKNTEEDDKEEKLAADNEAAVKTSRETRSERHKRRLKQVVDVSLKDNGVGHTHDLHKSCSERLYRVCKSFLKDLSSSHGLNEEMKRLAKSNVEQVIAFESKRVEKKRDKK